MESPGTAPGSDPLITCAFMSIVRANPNGLNIGSRRAGRKRAKHRSSCGCSADLRGRRVSSLPDVMRRSRTHVPWRPARPGPGVRFRHAARQVFAVSSMARMARALRLAGASATILDGVLRTRRPSRRMSRLPILKMDPNRTLPRLECGFGANPSQADRSGRIGRPADRQSSERYSRAHAPEAQAHNAKGIPKGFLWRVGANRTDRASVFWRAEEQVAPAGRSRAEVVAARRSRSFTLRSLWGRSRGHPGKGPDMDQIIIGVDRQSCCLDAKPDGFDAENAAGPARKGPAAAAKAGAFGPDPPG